MKMQELIDKVSAMYRTERNEVGNLKQELNSIECSLMDSKEMNFENISHADYQSFITRSEFLRQEIHSRTQHYEGISCVREMLMDLGFDTKLSIYEDVRIMNTKTEKMINEVEKLNNNVPDGLVIDADTILVDLINNCDYEFSGFAQDIFNIWKDSTDKKAVEQMFYEFTGKEFINYLMKCKEKITR